MLRMRESGLESGRVVSGSVGQWALSRFITTNKKG